MPKKRTSRAFRGSRVRCRAMGSSSGIRYATPLRQRPSTFTRTHGFVTMLGTQSEWRPCSAMIQNVLPSRPLRTGVRRSRPLLRPTTSRSARAPGRPMMSRMIGFQMGTRRGESPLQSAHQQSGAQPREEARSAPEGPRPSAQQAAEPQPTT